MSSSELAPDEEVLSLRYQGYNHDEINRKNGFSTGKISGIFAKEKVRFGAANVDAITRVGIQYAKAENHGPIWLTR
ncbi:hypothetical protein Ngar_c27490 [Candidatus Nitrososphaera gargensis Ga9.2]|uniref:Uncharacterized protein n=1 Tax=Nitrososphaera gargensis (strain Ga9.2) TaxID=1237085 RepID=K0IIB3_NITGG|nr:hypothetical protein [Candidatus Nitrososphaera gargensis]AFU59670.1 hypothetical protein Ngar_c27490 [Candidatus Nitrososphaera gargensis Ga9.2]